MPPPTKELLERLEKEDGGYDRDDCLKALLEAKGDEAEALAHLRRSRAGATGNVDETTPTSISPANVAIEVSGKTLAQRLEELQEAADAGLMNELEHATARAALLGLDLGPGPVTAQPVQAQPVNAEVKAQPVNVSIPVNNPGGGGGGGEFPGKRSAEDLAGCWGCVCLPGGCAIEAKQSLGHDTLYHKGVAMLFFALPIAYEDRWDRQGRSNVFKKEGADDTLNYGPTDCICFGPGCTQKLAGPSCGALFGMPRDWREFQKNEIAGQWTCVCVPGGCGHYSQQDIGGNAFNKAGVVCLFFGIPVKFGPEPWDKIDGRNITHKRGDEGSRNVYFTPNWICHGCGCECKG